MKWRYTLPPIALMAGSVGYYLRRQELDTAFDPATGLAVMGVWSWGLIALFAAFCLFAALAVRGFRPGGEAAEYLRPPNRLFFCAMCVSAGFSLAAGLLFLAELWGVLTRPDLQEAVQGMTQLVSRAVTGVFAILTCPALVLLGLPRGSRLRGGRYSLSSLAPGFLCAAWLVTTYQRRSGDPVVLHYALPLLAIIASAIASYQLAGLRYDEPKPRTAAWCGLVAAALCTAALSEHGDAAATMLYLSMGVYLFTNLAALFHYRAKPAPAPDTAKDMTTEEWFHE